eukprot:5112775-Amphidinium_carterae.1
MLQGNRFISNKRCCAVIGINSTVPNNLTKLSAKKGVVLLNNTLHGLIHGLNVMAPNECHRRLILSTTVVKRCRLCCNISELATFVSRIAGQIEDEASSDLVLEDLHHTTETSTHGEQGTSPMVVDDAATSAFAGVTTLGDEHFTPEVLHNVVMTLEERVHGLETGMQQLAEAHQAMVTKLRAYDNSSSLLFRIIIIMSESEVTSLELRSAAAIKPPQTPK